MFFTGTVLAEIILAVKGLCGFSPKRKSVLVANKIKLSKVDGKT